MTGPGSPDILGPPGGACRLCRLRLPAAVLSLGRQPVDDRVLADGDPEPEIVELALATCRRCGLIQLAGPPARRPPGLVHGQGGSFSSTIRDHADGWAESLVHSRPGPGLRVLDLADGRSAVFDALRRRGATVVAGSTPPDVLDRARATALVAHGGPFDLVIADHALAHADDLADLLASACAALAPDGRLAIEAHSAAGLVEGQFDIVNHAHRTYLTATVLEDALAREGLAVLETELDPLHGGTLRISAARAGRVATDRSDPDRSQQDRERRLGLDDGSGLHSVQAQAETIATDLRDFLADVRRRGGVAAGYGAAARGATLLAFAGIGQADLSVIYDRDPAKAGGHLPVSGIPIRPAAALAEEHPDWMLILPWPLADEIVAQLAAVSEHATGTRFVVGLPRLRVLT